MEKINKYLEKLFILLVSALLAIIAIFLYRHYSTSKYLLVFEAVLIVINTSRLFLDQFWNKAFDYIIRYRYIISLGVFCFLVLFKLNGSSIGVYNTIFKDTKNSSLANTELVGHSRTLRSDEFDVQTPYYFSQYYNDFKMTSHQMSISGQNMILGYNAPVKDITQLSKPFTLGYIFLGNEIGLSWYWCSKIILTLLVMYEAFFILLRKNKTLSALASLAITFSPAMQWWFAPHFYDVFFWAMTLFVLGYYFFISRGKIKWIVTVLTPLAIVGFVLHLFPSLQVPLGLLAIVLLFVCLVRDRKEIQFTKYDFIRLICAGIYVIAVLGRFIIQNYSQISLLMNTVYPGARISLGKDAILGQLFNNLTLVLIPFVDSNYLNNCEVSAFYHFGVLCLLYFIFIVYKWIKSNRKLSINMGVGISLFVALILEMYFMLFGFSKLIAKITLFSYINRMFLVYSFTALIFTFWEIDAVSREKEIRNIPILIICTVIYMVLHFITIPPYNVSYIINYPINIIFRSKFFFILEILFFTLIALLLFVNRNKTAASMYMCIILVSGFTVNPVVIGSSAITNHKIYDVIQTIVKKDNENWLALNTLYGQNYLLASGAKSINAVNFYPDYGKWHLVDKSKKYDNAYNRYAHLLVNLGNKRSFSNKHSPDAAEVTITYDDLKKWKVKYILVESSNDQLYHTSEVDNIKFIKIYENSKDSHCIYQLDYQ